MNNQNLFDYIQKCGCCQICCLRYLKARGNEYEDASETLKMLNITVTRNFTVHTDSESEPIPEYYPIIYPGFDPNRKRYRTNACVTCLDFFCPDALESTIEHIECHPDIEKYDCTTFCISLSLPLLLNIRQCSMWLGLIEKFGKTEVNDRIPSEVSIKEAAKLIMTPQLCRKLRKTYDQDGIMISVDFYHKNDDTDIEKLEKLDKDMFPNKRGGKQDMTRAYFEKTYIPANICGDTYRKYFNVPPEYIKTSIGMSKISFIGPTVFVAGRYRKLSRKLSHTPWILAGQRVIENSIQEIIIENIHEYFGDSEKMIFSSSGREDVDVRCLGGGRPFIIEIPDSRRTIFPKELAIKIQQKIETTNLISVNNLQIVGRDEIGNIKAGEEMKKKSYRALCILKKPVTVKILETLNIPNGFRTEQITPIRVLHRRPLHMRPRTIHSVKAYADRKHKNLLILDVTTQAGTYIKELVHGEFGRTKPSISSLINQWIDIVALDVIDIDINWPRDTDSNNGVN